MGIIAMVLAVSVGGTIDTVRDPDTTRYGSTVWTAAQAFNSGVWSGWIEVGRANAICFDLFHDYTGNAGVTMRCETSSSSSTTNDAGYDIHVLSVSAGTATSSTLTWSNATGADERWTWCVDDIPGDWLNCYFDDTSGNNGTDTIQAIARGVSP